MDQHVLWGDVSPIEHESDSGCTFFRVLGRSNAFSHMVQEWTRLRYQPGSLLEGEWISFCGGDGGLIGGIAIAGGLNWSFFFFFFWKAPILRVNLNNEYTLCSRRWEGISPT